MSGSKALDTNAVSAFLDENDSILQLTKDSELFIPSPVIGELYFGVYKSARPQTNLQHLANFLSDKVVLRCDSVTGQLYGQIKFQLRQKGRPIPENDVWIAAVARQYNLVLITRDQHFNEVELLQIESW